MKLHLFFSLLISLSFASAAVSQQRMTVQDYIDRYKDLAVEEMKKHKIPASITLAQGILESSSGNSDLATKANNHFGIKCHREWNGKTFHKDDDEKDECFRKYKDPEESYRDHSDFLTSRDRYKNLFNLDITDYKGWAFGLKQAGYATNPRYPELLIKIIEENRLDQFDGGRRSSVVSRQSLVKTQNSKLRTQNSELSYEIAGRGGNDRVIFKNNGVKFILARKGDDFSKIAGEFGIYAWQVREYNELNKKDRLVPGEKVYLEKKKSKAGYDFHKVIPGETLRSVAQDYGMRLKVLCRLNGIKPAYMPLEGELLKLR